MAFIKAYLAASPADIRFALAIARDSKGGFDEALFKRMLIRMQNWE